MEPYPIGHQPGASFDLDVMVMEIGEVIQVWWQYNTDLFDGATIARMAGHFQNLLEGIVANPHQKLSELRLLTAAERHQLLVEWNDTKAEYPSDKCVHQLFEAQVERSPDAVAVLFEYRQLTYGELNAKANQLAHYLQKLGVKAEVLVGICVQRSLEMVVGLLGILKAGGPYLPLDPAFPKHRIPAASQLPPQHPANTQRAKCEFCHRFYLRRRLGQHGNFSRIMWGWVPAYHLPRQGNPS